MRAEMGRQVVAWSGGPDSTLVLTHYARASSDCWPLSAVTVLMHPQIEALQMKGQREAQDHYLK